MIRFLVVAALLFSIAPVFAEDAPPTSRFICPDKNPCRFLILNDQEVAALLNERGILPTAAAARALDLAGAVTYFQNKIASAPRGEAPPEPPKSENDSKLLPPNGDSAKNVDKH